MTSPHSRVAAGVPTGGQFAARTQPRAPVSLGEVRDTPGLEDAHQLARERVAAETDRAERIGAQLLAERVTAHYPDAAVVRLVVGDQDMRLFLYVESVRDADGGEIRISSEVADELNDFAADLHPVHSKVTEYDDEGGFDALDVRKDHLREGDLG